MGVSQSQVSIIKFQRSITDSLCYGLIGALCVCFGQLSTQLTFASLCVVCEQGLCRLQ